MSNSNSPVTNGYNGMDDDMEITRTNSIGRIVIDLLEKQALRLRGSDRQCLRRACKILVDQPEPAEFRSIETQTEQQNENEVSTTTETQLPNTEMQISMIKIEKAKKEIQIEIKQEKSTENEINLDAQNHLFHGRDLILRGKPLNVPLDVVSGSQLTDPRMRTELVVRIIPEMTEVNSSTYETSVSSPNSELPTPSTLKVTKSRAESIGSPENTEIIDMDICSSPEPRQIVTNVPYNPFVRPNAPANVRPPTPTQKNPFVKPK